MASPPYSGEKLSARLILSMVARLLAGSCCNTASTAWLTLYESVHTKQHAEEKARTNRAIVLSGFFEKNATKREMTACLDLFYTSEYIGIDIID